MDRELTFGEKAVGISLISGVNPDVSEIKALYAQVIDKLNELRGVDRNEKARLLSVAITEAQGAQMWAIKGATWQD